MSKSSNLIKIIKENDFGKILSLDVEFREIGKVFSMHIIGCLIQKSYLGHTKRGGGSRGSIHMH